MYYFNSRCVHWRSQIDGDSAAVRGSQRQERLNVFQEVHLVLGTYTGRCVDNDSNRIIDIKLSKKKKKKINNNVGIRHMV